MPKPTATPRPPQPASAPPPSATTPLAGYLGVVAFLITVAVLRQLHLRPVAAAIWTLAVTLGAILAVELWKTRNSPAAQRYPLFHRQLRRPLGNYLRPGADRNRWLTKLLGLAVTLGLVAALYWVFPEYHGNFYDIYWRLLKTLLPGAIALAPIYFLLVDATMEEPHDGYWQLGRRALGHPENSDLLAQHALGWLVKAFFLPLMFTYFTDNLAQLRKATLTPPTFRELYLLGDLVIQTIDVGFAALGYLMTARAIDGQIRSVESTLLGWAAAVMCYQPFFSLIGSHYLDHGGQDMSWYNWLEGYPELRVIWGGCALGLMIIFTWATVVFGYRFSNLTHRGIITHGPYRWTKHPAYLSKNLAWWLIYIPYAPEGEPLLAVRHALLLLLLNGVYYLRAKTEERQLAWDPDYQAYSAWIAQHGVIARLRRPFSR